MVDRLIINTRKQLSWHRRAASDVITAGIWVGWLALWLPVFRKLHEVALYHLGVERAAIEIFDTVSPIPIQYSLISLLGTSALLLLWTLLPTYRAAQAHAVEELEDYATYFELSMKQIQTGRASRICMVSHDDRGGIVHIEPVLVAAIGNL